MSPRQTGSERSKAGESQALSVTGGMLSSAGVEASIDSRLGCVCGAERVRVGGDQGGGSDAAQTQLITVILHYHREALSKCFRDSSAVLYVRVWGCIMT